jgi:hypothetical protein
MNTACNEIRRVLTAAVSEAAGRWGRQLALAVLVVGAILLSLENGLRPRHISQNPSSEGSRKAKLLGPSSWDAARAATK